MPERQARLGPGSTASPPDACRYLGTEGPEPQDGDSAPRRREAPGEGAAGAFAAWVRSLPVNHGRVLIHRFYLL